MTLSDTTIQRIRDKGALRRALMDYFPCTERTLYKYLRINSRRLTEAGSLDIISLYLRIPKEDLLSN